MSQRDKTIYGAALGILMLETRFPRPLGDMGNALTWPFPVLYHVVEGASPDRVVRNRAEGLLPAFIAAGRNLIRAGADGITTNCGFLSLFQDDLATALNVPVLTSSLMQVRWVDTMLPRGYRSGIVTICAASLSGDHLAAAGVEASTPIIGMDPNGPLSSSILNDRSDLDYVAARDEIVGLSRQFCLDHGELGALVLECTNMTPYASAIMAATGLPVFTMANFVNWFHGGLSPRCYGGSDCLARGR